MASPAASSSERIGDLLVREGMISREQLDKALMEQRQNGTRVGYNLVKLGFIQELELTKMLAKQYKMPAVDLSRFQLDPKIVKLIPTDVAVKNLVLPLKREGRTLTVAMADPTNFAVIEDLKFITRFDIVPVIAGEFTVRTLVEKHYEAADTQMASLLDEISQMVGDEDLEVVEEREEEVSAAALTAAVEDAPVVKMINALTWNREVNRVIGSITFNADYLEDDQITVATSESPDIPDDRRVSAGRSYRGTADLTWGLSRMLRTVVGGNVDFRIDSIPGSVAETESRRVYADFSRPSNAMPAPTRHPEFPGQ